MNYVADNIGAIVTATVVGLAVGATCYANSWPRCYRSGAARNALWLLFVAAVAEFWLAAILAGALILAPTPASAWTMAIGSAVVIWVGFVVPVLAATYMFRRLPMSALLQDGTHWLFVMVTQAVTLHLIGLSQSSN